MRRAAALVPVAVTLAVVGIALAAQNWSVHLTGDQEIPARDTNAQGQAIFHLSEDGTELQYKLDVANIENVVASHIHCGSSAVNGPVVVFLYGPVPAGGGRIQGPIAEGVITDADVLPQPPSQECPGGVTDLDDVIAKMNSGGAYVNVHTNDGVAPANTGPGDFPGGEIRGNF